VLSEARDTASKATGQFVYEQEQCLELSVNFSRNVGCKYGDDI
jgi:hypothetical protein